MFVQLQCGCGNNPRLHTGETEHEGGSTMCKTFFLKPGHLARCDGLWYEPGILLAVGKRDRVELFTARSEPPAGLLDADKTWNKLAAANGVH
jgi:hypothetical protein